VSDAPAVEFRGVSKSFAEGRGARVVFEHVDLALARGATHVVLGRSGSGKSTLLNLISGIDLPDAGLVRVLGADLVRLSEDERTRLRRERIALVFQFFNLIPTLSLLENLLLPAELCGARARDERPRALELLSSVGLADRAGAFPDRLSGGEQQRAALARALMTRPELVLMDEPTGNLDEESGAAVIDLVERLLVGSGATLVVVTHSREWLRLADRLWRVHAGRLEEAAGAP
jgi:putative ABC transport system ATP-binding protein